MAELSFIEVKDLTYYYPNNEHPSLDNVAVNIEEGEFVLLLGRSGSGKSTLAKTLTGMVPQFYGGKMKGRVNIDGEDIETINRRELIQKVGIVFQDPESQMVMTNVEQELVFGLENLGLENSLMKRRVLEVSSALSLGGYLKKNVSQLSGGLKQMVALGAILAMQPNILILDEPTSQLDPVAGEEFLTMLRRLNEENGITIILIEQRLERCFHLADRYLIMDEGKIIRNTTDHNDISKWAVQNNTSFIPPLAKLFAVSGFNEIPLTVKSGRKMIRSVIDNKEKINKQRSIVKGVEKHIDSVMDIERVWFVYDNGEDVLQDISFSIYPGDFTVIMGENGAGKTTLLKNMNGLLKPSKGKIRFMQEETNGIPLSELGKKVGYLFQNPSDYLFLNSVREEVNYTLNNLEIRDPNRVDYILDQLGLSSCIETNPRDLSIGERQRVALATVLVGNPDIILLDEPTMGLDYELKKILGEILLLLQKQGKALIVVTHDVEFAAQYAQDIMFMSQGRIIAHGDKRTMLTRSTFYSSQISKLFSRIDDSIITVEEGEKFLKSIFLNSQGGTDDKN